MTITSQRAFELLPLAARTETLATPDQALYGETQLCNGVLVVIVVTAITDTPEVTPSIQGKDPVSGEYVSLLTASSPIGATGTFAYLLSPGAASASAGVTQSASYPLPPDWRVNLVHGDADSITYSVGALLLY